MGMTDARLLQGRDDDVILSAGYRIGPFEVESELLRHQSVAESAVVGMEDSERRRRLARAVQWLARFFF
jgi:acyl-coenzyme A synthetase/AMP-(fatty) acid ligase